MTKRELMADAVLVLTAFIWGTGFVVMKNTVDSVPPGMIIAIRYAIASVLSAVLFQKHLKGLTRRDVGRGAVVGALLCGAYIVQTIGLSLTTAGKNAFLTTVYVLLVPFGCYLVFRQKLSRKKFIAAAMMLAGWRERRTESGRCADAGRSRALCGAHHGGGALPAEDQYLCADCTAVCLFCRICMCVCPAL